MRWVEVGCTGEDEEVNDAHDIYNVVQVGINSRTVMI